MDAATFAASAGAPLNKVGAGFYFDPVTLAKGKELGLDGFRMYVLGRGGVLGDVEAPVVQAAFGYFQMDLVEKIWGSAKEIMAPRDGSRAYHEACADYGRSRFADIEGLAAFNAGAEAIIAAQPVAGLSLYAAWAAEPMVDDVPGRAAQLAAVLRELRGSAHLVAIVASGLNDQQAHFLKRPDDYAMFGWSDPPEIDDSHRAAMDTAEDLTNQLLAPAFGVVPEGERAAFCATAEAMQGALAG
ncbi:MAG: hypothetical protein AAGA99_16380 [Actinomycetota bacterium]